MPKTSAVERVTAQNQEAKENFFPFQSKQIEDESPYLLFTQASIKSLGVFLWVNQLESTVKRGGL